MYNKTFHRVVVVRFSANNLLLYGFLAIKTRINFTFDSIKINFSKRNSFAHGLYTNRDILHT